MERTIRVTINGKEESAPEGVTLADLVGRLGLPYDRVAIEHNLEIAHRGQWAATTLHEGDRLEIVQFVGGG